MTKINFMRLTHAEIYLNNLKDNFLNIKVLLKPQTKICAAVKADGYGNGAVKCAKTLVEAGADFLAVANVEEAMELRNAGIKTPLLMLSLCSPEEVDDVIKNSVTPLVFDEEYINLFDSRSAELNKSGEKFSVHLAIDSGMGRIGCRYTEAKELAEKIVNSKNLTLGGMCTHFACADSIKKSDVKYTITQYENFMKAIDEVERAGINPGIRHCCNSPALITHPEWQLDMVRPGIILYGYYCDQVNRNYIEKNNINLNLKPVMTLVSGVCSVRNFKKGNSVSYGHTWTAKKDTDIAVIPIGYGDGFLRRFSSVVKPAVNGKAYPICGRICMDQCMIEIGLNNSDVKRWDRVVLFGSKEAGALCDAQDIADATGTIPYEIMTGITKRVERVYIK